MSAVHDFADRLLDLAYGELPQPEAKELETHVRGCSQCASALDEIKGVRRVMGQLPAAHEPDTGLESLIAYAEQAARRQAAGPVASAGWRRWLAPVLGFTAVAALAAVTLTTLGKSEFASPSQIAAEQKFEAAPVSAVEPESPPKSRALESDDEKNEEAQAKSPAVVAEMKPDPEPQRRAAKLQKVQQNMAVLDSEVAGNSNFGTGRGSGADLGSLSGGKGSGFGDGVGIGQGPTGYADRSKAKEKSEGGGGYLVNTPPAAVADKKSSARDQSPPAEEFQFEERAPKQDVAMHESKTRARSVSKDAEEPPAVAAAPPPPMEKAEESVDDVVAMAPSATTQSVEADADEDDRYDAPAKKSASKVVVVDQKLVDLRRLVSVARAAKANGDRASEAKYLREAVLINIRHPEHAGALIMLGDAEEALGNTSAAAYAWRQAETLYPSTGTSQIANIKLNQQKGVHDAAGQGKPADMKRAAPRKEMDMESSDRPAAME